MKIAFDAMGGDFAPEATIEGVKLALNDFTEENRIVLTGNQEVLRSMMEAKGISSELVEIVHADEVIEMGEHPTKALTQKPNSSIAKGFGLLRSQEVNAFCSAGNTGAMLVGAMFTIKAIEGVIRPGIAGFIPKETGNYGIIIDVGANADCKPDVLVQFAEMGSIYVQHVFGIENPTVGLMNLGEEEQKGTLLTQAAYQLFKLDKKLNFIGNIEGRDLFNEKADVIVCDGFTGNVILKFAESIYDILKKKELLDPFFERFDYEAIGGSPILGVNGNVIIGHGVSSPEAIHNMLIQAKKMAESKIYLKIKQSFAE